jgi:hypothetical protein
VALVGGALLVLSAFLPWFTATVFTLSISRNGMQLGQGDSFSIDGLLMVLFGVEVLIVAVTRLTAAQLPTWLQSSTIVVGVAAVAVALFEIPSVNDLVNHVRQSSSIAVASVGFGLYVAILGGLVAVGGGIAMRTGSPRAAVTAQAVPGHQTSTGYADIHEERNLPPE